MAQSAGDVCPRRGFAGVERFGAPGAYTGRGLAVAHVRDMGDTLVALAGLEEVSGGAGSAAAGRRGETRRRAAFCGIPGLRPNWGSANGGVGLWGAHRGVVVDGEAT